MRIPLSCFFLSKSGGGEEGTTKQYQKKKKMSVVAIAVIEILTVAPPATNVPVVSGSTQTPPAEYNPSETSSSSGLIVIILIGILSALALMLLCVGVYIYKLSQRISEGKETDETQIRNRLLADEVVSRQKRLQLEKDAELQLGEYGRKFEEMKKLQNVDVYENRLKELMDEGYEKEVAMILIHCNSAYEKTLRTSIKDLSKEVDEREDDFNKKKEEMVNETLRRESEEHRNKTITLKAPANLFEIPGKDNVPDQEGEYLPPSRTVRRDVDLSVIKHEMELADARRVSTPLLPELSMSSTSSDDKSFVFGSTAAPTRFIPKHLPAVATDKDPTYNTVQNVGKYRTGRWDGVKLPEHPQVKAYVSGSKGKSSPNSKTNEKNSISKQQSGTNKKKDDTAVLTLTAPIPPSKPKKAADGRILKSVII